MKTTVAGLAAILILCMVSTAHAVMIGDTRETVLSELGTPDSYIGTSNREMMTYERGEVVLVDGAVASLALMSEEEALRRRLLREQEAAERAERERARRERLAAEGTEIRLRKLADTDFMMSSAAVRLAFWKQFRSQYPMVEVGEEYGAALRERQLELAAENAGVAAERRLRELEMRVAQAEADAAYAGGTTFVSAGHPVYIGGTSCRRARRPSTAWPCSHGKRVCNASCGSRSGITRFSSSAGYGFQRPLKQGGVRVQVGLNSCNTGARIKPLRGPVDYAYPQAFSPVSPSWFGAGGGGVHKVHQPVSRSALTARASIRF